MAEVQSTSGQGRDLLFDTGEEIPEHVPPQSTAVGEDDDRDISNLLGEFGTSSSLPTNGLGLSVTQNESPIPGPSYQAPLQAYIQYQYNQEAPTTHLEGSYLPQHRTSQAMEGILDQNGCSYGESAQHRIMDAEATHRSLEMTPEMTPLGPSYEVTGIHTPISPLEYNSSTHLGSMPFMAMIATPQTYQGPDYSTLPSMGRQDTSGQESHSGDDQPLDISSGSVDADHMDIDEEGSENTCQSPWDLSQVYTQSSSSATTSLSASEALIYSPLPSSLTYFPQADVQTNAAVSQPDNSAAISMGSSTASPVSVNDLEDLGVPPNHDTTQAETEAAVEDVAINDLLGLDSIPEPQSVTGVEPFDLTSSVQDTNGLVFEPASQTHAPTSVDSEHSAGLAEGTTLPLQQNDGALLSWSSQDVTQMPGLAPLPSLHANVVELSDLYDIDEDFERNQDVCEFFEYWRFRYEMMKPPQCPNIGVLAMDLRRSPRPNEISIEDLDEQHCDYQGISWADLDTVREEARALRKSTYVNYTNIQNRYPSAVSIDINQWSTTA